MWTRRVYVNSVVPGRAHSDIDSMAQYIYFVCDYALQYFYICKLLYNDGTVTYCAKYDGDDYDYPFMVKSFGDFLLVHGSSRSSIYLSDPGHTYANFVLWLRNDMQSNTECSALNIDLDFSLSWTNDPLPKKSINTADVSISSRTDYSSSSALTLTNPSLALHVVCSFDPT